jgi:hypothetical protein
MQAAQRPDAARAYAPGSIRDGYVAEAVKARDHIRTLELLAMKIARRIDATTSPREVAALSRQLMEVTDRLKAQAQPDASATQERQPEKKRETKLNVIQNIHASRLPGAQAQKGA